MENKELNTDIENEVFSIEITSKDFKMKKVLHREAARRVINHILLIELEK